MYYALCRSWVLNNDCVAFDGWKVVGRKTFLLAAPHESGSLYWGRSGRRIDLYHLREGRQSQPHSRGSSPSASSRNSSSSISSSRGGVVVGSDCSSNGSSCSRRNSSDDNSSSNSSSSSSSSSSSGGDGSGASDYVGDDTGDDASESFLRGSEASNGSTSWADLGSWLEGDRRARAMYPLLEEVHWWVAHLEPGGKQRVNE